MSDKQMTRTERNKRKKKRRPGGFWKWVKRLFLIFFLLGMLGLVAGGGLFVYYASSAPEMTEEDLLGTFSSELVDRNGNTFYVLGAEQRDFASPDEYPQVIKDAFMAIEDQRFETHFGIDPIGIGRAAIGFVTNRGQIAGGGSTITQQLVKLSVFSTLQEDQTLERKAQEAWLAVLLERQLSKEQILSLYMNKIPMSGNVYGVATATEEFYGKPVQELELHEAALFAGMAQAPNRYNPYENPETAQNRRDIVLRVMADIELITQDEAENAMAIDVQEGLQDRTRSSQNNLVFDGYLRAVLDEVAEKTEFDPRVAGLEIHTNLDMDAQQELYRILNEEDVINFPNNEIQAAASLVDVQTGQVTAIGGGRHQEGQLSTNYATSLDRNIGSTIKPLTTYAPAIEFLEYSTYHQVVDEEFDYEGWNPSNYDNQYVGQGSIRDFVVDSRNIPAAKIFNEDLDMQGQVVPFLENIGIDATELNSDGGPYPQNAINGRITPLQLAASYAAFANEGYYTEPYTVSKIIAQDGQEYDLTPETNQAMEDYTAYMITDILKDFVELDYARVGIDGLTQAGKTGTTNYTQEQLEQYNLPSDAIPDAWYVGYSRNYSLSVWVGYPNQFEEGNYLTYADGTHDLPRNVYQSFMSYVHQDVENSDWNMPSSVVEVTVEDGTNPAQLPGPYTPDSELVTELFVSGSDEEPGSNDISTEYGEELGAPTGLTADYDEDEDELTVTWDEYALGNDDEEVSYELTIDGESISTSDTEFTLSEPDEGTLQISLVVEAYGNTGPAATTSIVIPEREEEEPDEDDDDDEDENGDDDSDNDDDGEEDPPEDEDPGDDNEDPGDGEEDPGDGEEDPPEDENPGDGDDDSEDPDQDEDNGDEDNDNN